MPQDQEMFINGGSRYGVNYFIEPLRRRVFKLIMRQAYEHGGNNHTAEAACVQLELYLA